MNTVVSNPYAFNIKTKVCRVRPIAPPISNNAHRAKLTMIYSKSDEIIRLEYESHLSGSSLDPDTFNKIYISHITLEYDYSNNQLYCLIQLINFHDSKIILNGGIFNNLEVPYKGNSSFRRNYVYSGKLIGTDPTHWKDYNKVPFDCTIEFVYKD